MFEGSDIGNDSKRRSENSPQSQSQDSADDSNNIGDNQHLQRFKYSHYSRKAGRKNSGTSNSNTSSNSDQNNSLNSDSNNFSNSDLGTSFYY